MMHPHLEPELMIVCSWESCWFLSRKPDIEQQFHNIDMVLRLKTAFSAYPDTAAVDKIPAT
jgi:hypothetical protein